MLESTGAAWRSASRQGRGHRGSRSTAIAAAVGLAFALSGCGAASGIAAGGQDEAAATAAPTVEGRPQQSVPAPAPSDQQPDSADPSVAGWQGSGEPVRIAFAGDVHFEEPIRGYLDSDPSSVLAPVKQLWSRADLTVLNLETAITDGGDPAPAKPFHFRAPASAFDALRAGGVDVVTVANNHGMDYGESGLQDTLENAKAKKFPIVGAGQTDADAYAPYRTTINGQRIAVIGATQVLDNHLIDAWSAQVDKPGLASAKREKRLLSEVRQARPSTDTLIVYLHYGIEKMECPSAAQQDIAQKLVAAGADIVVGSHAHVLSGGGMMGDAFVDYGLGNFVFYAGADPMTRTGVLEVTATGRQIDDYKWNPAQIQGGRPVPLTGEAKRERAKSWVALRGCTGLQP